MKVLKILKKILDKDKRFLYLDSKGFFKNMDDKKYLEKKFNAITGLKLNLNNPKTFNEKLQWLKLYDRKKIYTKMVDKYEAKQYVKSIIGNQYIIPTIGVWNSFEEIDFDKLPDQFVLKCTHDSGGLVICNKKSEINIKEVEKKLNKSLNNNYYYKGREWPYKNIKPRIIAEKLMVDKNVIENKFESSGLIDYKFYCFNGQPKFLYVGYANIVNDVKKDMLSFYDLNWKKAPFYRQDYEELNFNPVKPEKFNEMITIAKKLSKDVPFLRVDLYYIDGNIYFSELTFFPGSGYGIFSPSEWELKIGEWIDLPENEVKI